MRYAPLALLLLVCAGAHGQTMFKCHDQGKIVYSDKPCLNGVEMKQLRPDGSPTAEELGRARMKARAEEQRALERRACQGTQRRVRHERNDGSRADGDQADAGGEYKGLQGSDGAAGNVASTR